MQTQITECNEYSSFETSVWVEINFIKSSKAFNWHIHLIQKLNWNQQSMLFAHNFIGTFLSLFLAVFFLSVTHFISILFCERDLHTLVLPFSWNLVLFGSNWNWIAMQNLQVQNTFVICISHIQNSNPQAPSNWS